jgi:serine/threonine protein kinase
MPSKSPSLSPTKAESNPPLGFPPSRWRTPQRADTAGGLVVGRYALFGEIASGGMATVHFGRLLGPAGFSRVVAVKRLHPQLAKEAEFVSMFINEVRLAARVQHPNVVATLDVVEDGGELFLVMEYVHGESLAQLIRAARKRGLHVPPAIASSIVCGLLHGLHAAHEATSETGEPLGIIHRDVSPQNVLVGTDGVTRVLDFGIARAARRLQNTREGQLKGKAAYLAPERIHGHEADRRTDVYGAAVVLWETLTGVTLFDGDNDAAVLAQIVSGSVSPPSSLAPDIPPVLEAITLALQQRVGLVAPSEVGDWVTSIAAAPLAERARYLAQLDGMVSEAPRFDSSRPGPPRPAGEPHTRPVPQSDPPPAIPVAVSGFDAASGVDAPVGALETSSAAPRTPEASGGAVSTEVEPRRRGSTWLVGSLIVLAGLSSGAAFVLRQKSWLTPESFASSPPAAPSPNVPRGPVAAPILAAPAPTLAAVLDSPERMLEPVASDPVRAPAGISPIKGSSSTRRRPISKTAPPTKSSDGDQAVVAPPVAPPPGDSCQPPYTVDSAGAKHFKVDCVIDGRR